MKLSKVAAAAVGAIVLNTMSSKNISSESLSKPSNDNNDTQSSYNNNLQDTCPNLLNILLTNKNSSNMCLTKKSA